jgi:hypothetical protein
MRASFVVCMGASVEPRGTSNVRKCFESKSRLLRLEIREVIGTFLENFIWFEYSVHKASCLANGSVWSMEQMYSAEQAPAIATISRRL